MQQPAPFGPDSRGAPSATPIPRRSLVWFAAPMALLTAAGWIGDALAPSLLAHSPLVLIALNPRLRNLLLVSPSVSAGPFFAVAMFRQVLSDPLFFWFGSRYGDTAIRWMERRLGPGAKPVLWMEKAFRRAAYPMVAIAPNNIICLLAGATTMAWLPFLLLNLGGTAARIGLIRLLGDVFADPILTATDWIADNRRWLTLVTVTLVVVTVFRSYRSGRGELETPEELELELEAAEEELAAEPPTSDPV